MAATPPPVNGEMPTKVTFRFCRECSNMLYPKEDTLNNTLMFACRTCQFSEPAVTTCVYRNELSNTVGETAGITQDVGSDPTVGIPDFCTMCGQEMLCESCGYPFDGGLCLEVDERAAEDTSLSGEDGEEAEMDQQYHEDMDSDEERT